MTRFSWLAGGAVAMLVCFAQATFAQPGAGGLRGTVTDAQGGALPGVTVMATSPDMLGVVNATTNEEGVYRLINLPPGTYTVQAELGGFATFRREGILLRAGATFAVDITMQLSTVQETVTVSGDSPMIEVDKPSNVLNIDGEFQRMLPLQARRNWSDFLDLTAGVISRPFDDGSGRQVYFGHATEHFAHVIQLEGTLASNYHDAQVTYVGMGADMVGDIQVKSGGVDASTPMGTGLAMNVITKSGGNQFKGTAAFAYQPLDWNADNTNNCSESAACKPATGGTPTTAYVRQFDGSFGGPIQRDKLWFFGSIRRAVNESGISRTGIELERLQAFVPGFVPFNNTSDTWQPYVKVTGKAAASHEFSGFYQRDRLFLTGDREFNYEPIQVQSTGGSLYGAKLTSLWGSRLTSTITASYNNKGGSDVSTFENLGTSGPQIIIHQAATPAGAGLAGTGRILEGGNLQNYQIQPASQIIIRGDVTYYRDEWFGSHEFGTGVFIAPRNTYDQTTQYPNNGFTIEDRRLVDPNNLGGGAVAFRRRTYQQAELTTRQARDRDIGIYIQDTWRPLSRLTLNVGVRADFVRRWDEIFQIERQSSTEIGPRIGFSYLVTKDARNLVRGSYVRVHEQVMGRDQVTIFGANEAAGYVDAYDFNGDGIFEVSIPTAARSASIASYEFDPDLHQPFVDEFILGFRRQFSGQMSLDVAFQKRSYKETYARPDINGIYPSGPNQPFGGFGLIDPTRGVIFQQTNNTWSTLEWKALEITLAKNLSKNFQALVGINRQWQHYGGTWNPTDPARFIQPDAFPSDALLYMPRGNNEENSLPIDQGTTVHTYGPTWQQYSLRFGGTYFAPYGVNIALSYTQLAGPWSGAITYLLDTNDPQLAVFGPARASNGQNNPLSTRMRFRYPTRGDGQVKAPPIKTLGIKVGKSIRFGGREIEAAANIFNLFNAGDYTQYNYSGANEEWNPNFLQMRNQQPARALQLTAIFRF